MAADITAIVNALLAKTPEWLRRDLSSDSESARKRAEETLAAMISAALGQAPPEGH
jgi:hypothetical protein